MIPGNDLIQPSRTTPRPQNSAQANKAIASIKPKDIQEIKANKNPTDIIKMIFDCILILFKLPLEKVRSRRPVVESHAINLCPSHFHESGFFLEFEAVRTASLHASSRDAVRSGSNLDRRPPTSC